MLYYIYKIQFKEGTMEKLFKCQFCNHETVINTTDDKLPIMEEHSEENGVFCKGSGCLALELCEVQI